MQKRSNKQQIRFRRVTQIRIGRLRRVYTSSCSDKESRQFSAHPESSSISKLSQLIDPRQKSRVGERVVTLQGGITWSRVCRALPACALPAGGAVTLHSTSLQQDGGDGWRRVIKNESDVYRIQQSVWSQLTRCHAQHSRLSRGQRSRHCVLEGKWWRFLHLLLCCCSSTVTLMFTQLERF